jgi:hypothetical protein
MLLFPESGPTKDFWVYGFTKTVTLHLRSIGPNVQRHMAYFAPTNQLSSPRVAVCVLWAVAWTYHSDHLDHVKRHFSLSLDEAVHHTVEGS